MKNTWQDAQKFLEKINFNIGIYDALTNDNSHTFVQDRGAIAALKRALTDEPRHLRASAPILLPYLSDNLWHTDQWQFVACLFAYYPQPLTIKKRNFGVSIRDLNDGTESKAEIKGPERRFRALLNMPLEDLHVPLAAMVRLINAQKKSAIAIDYPSLIIDLCYWDHPDQFVQDRWAKSFWRAPSEPTGETTKATST